MARRRRVPPGSINLVHQGVINADAAITGKFKKALGEFRVAAGERRLDLSLCR